MTLVIGASAYEAGFRQGVTYATQFRPFTTPPPSNELNVENRSRLSKGQRATLRTKWPQAGIDSLAAKNNAKQRQLFWNLKFRKRLPFLSNLSVPHEIRGLRILRWTGALNSCIPTKLASEFSGRGVLQSDMLHLRT